MKVLQVCFKLPYPPNDGGAYSLYNSALCLLKTGEVDLKILAIKQLKNKDDETLIPISFSEKTDFTYVEIDNSIKPVNALKSLIKGTSYFTDRFYSVEFENRLIEIIQQNSFDIIQLEHSYLCIYIDTIKKYFKGKVILRAQNVEHKLWESYLKNKKWYDPFRSYLSLMNKRLKKMETASLGKIDGLICLSSEDEKAFRSLHQNIKSAVIPIGFDEEKLVNYTPSENNLSIYHLGSMDWLPNLQGIEWFLEEVLPELRKIKLHFEVHLAGKNMPISFKNNTIQNVIIDGEVPDSIHYQMDKSIMIVPLLSGGGIRVKIIEALALGKVIITTSKGASGIAGNHGENMLIADSPLSFAKNIADCLESPELRKRLSDNARKLFESDYKLSATGKQTLTFLEEIIA